MNSIERRIYYEVLRASDGFRSSGATIPNCRPAVVVILGGRNRVLLLALHADGHCCMPDRTTALDRVLALQCLASTVITERFTTPLGACDLRDTHDLTMTATD
jgi:hypothetical protein